jgi:hypothetical protein
MRWRYGTTVSTSNTTQASSFEPLNGSRQIRNAAVASVTVHELDRRFRPPFEEFMKCPRQSRINRRL